MILRGAFLFVLAGTLFLVLSYLGVFGESRPEITAEYPADCLPETGCRLLIEPLSRDVRIRISDDVEGCGLRGSLDLDPRSYPLWRTRPQAEHAACMNAIAAQLGDWQRVAAWLVSLDFVAIKGLWLIPNAEVSDLGSSARIEGIRLRTGLPQISATNQGAGAEWIPGTLVVAALFDAAGQFQALSLAPYQP